MAVKIALDSFVAVAKRSNLVARDQLKSLLAALQQERGGAGAGAGAVESRDFADYLVAQKALTPWQAEKLLQGKHKGFFLGKYRLLALLGKGGMSSVYLAEHVLMRRRCAIKVLPTRRVHDSSYLGRFHREAQAVAALDHPNIVRAYDVDHETDGDLEIHFLVMEFVEGKSLLDLVQSQGRLPEEEAADYVRQAALGLQHAHEAGLVHRDVKPGNLLVDPTGVVKLLDLGLARFFEGSEDVSLTVQHDEQILGTADYLSPEQAVDSHAADARADIYSLGCTFYFCIAGHPPFTQGTLAQRLLAHQTKEPSGLETVRPGVSAGLVAIQRKMMAKDKGARYQTAGEVAAALHNWLEKRGKSNAVCETGRNAPPRREVLTGVPSGSAPAAPAAAAPSRGSSRVAKPASSAARPPAAKGSRTPVAGGPVAPEFGAFLSHLEQEAEEGSSVHGSRAASRKGRARESNADIDALDWGLPQALPEAENRALSAAVREDEHVSAAVPADRALSAAIESSDSGASVHRSTSILVKGRGRKQKQRRRMIAAGAILFAGLLLVVTAVWGLGGDKGKRGRERGHSDGSQAAPVSPGDSAGSDAVAAATGEPDLGPELAVDSRGDFPSIAAALDYVARHGDKFGPQQAWTLKLAGGESYDGRIVVRGSDFRGRPPPIEIIAAGDPPAILRSSEAAPLIELEGIERLTIKGLVLEASGHPTAIQLSGFLVGTRLEDLTIRGFQEVGLRSADAGGLSRMPLRLISLRFITNAPEASAVQLGDARHLEFDGCVFAGPMRSGIELSSETWTSSIRIRRCRFHELRTGIRFANGPHDLQAVAITNNTFHRVQEGIAFDQPPREGSAGVVVHHNLFTEISGAELLVPGVSGAADWLPARSARNNWSERAGPASAAGEVDLFAAGGRRGVEGVTFGSRSPTSPEFLKPVNTAVRNELKDSPQGVEPYVGAIAP